MFVTEIIQVTRPYAVVSFHWTPFRLARYGYASLVLSNCTVNCDVPMLWRVGLLYKVAVV